MRAQNTPTTAVVKTSYFHDFFDQIGFRVRRPLSRRQMAFLRANSLFFGEDSTVACPIPGFYRERYIIIAPNQRALIMLAELDRPLIVYLEIKRAYTVPQMWIEVLRGFFDECFVQGHHGKHELVYQENITYTGQRRKGRTFDWYWNKHSKLTGEVCFQVEGRYQGSPALRAIGIHGFNDLLDFDFAAYWSDLRFFEFDLERLGRSHSNRLKGLRRRTPCKKDLTTGIDLYRQYGIHPKRPHQPPSIQVFIDRYGRGPFLAPISLDDIHAVFDISLL